LNPIKKFFLEEIPAVFTYGKLRMTLAKLNNQSPQLEKQKKEAIQNLGIIAWGNKIKDLRYEEIYTNLENIEELLSQKQIEINLQQSLIETETAQIQTVNIDFDKDIAEIQTQRQSVYQKLAQLQSKQKNIEYRINEAKRIINQGPTTVQNLQLQINQVQASGLSDKEARIASFQTTIDGVKKQVSDAIDQNKLAESELIGNIDEQKPIKSEIDSYDLQIKSIQDQKKITASTTQDKLKELQVNLQKLVSSKDEITKQKTDLMPELGKQVFLYRPPVDILTQSYLKIDTIQNEIARLSDQISITHIRLSSVNSKSLLKVGIFSSAIVLGFISIIIISIVILPAAGKYLRPDTSKDIRLVQSWVSDECNSSGEYTGIVQEVSVWENSQKSETAHVSIMSTLLGSKDVVLDSVSDSFTLPPQSKMVGFSYLDPKGSRWNKIEHTFVGTFEKSRISDMADLDIKASFANESSDSISLNLSITNKGDFSLSPINDKTEVLVINDRNELVALYYGDDKNDIIKIDSSSMLKFIQSPSFVATCKPGSFINENVTFWYFVPFQIGSSINNVFILSGKAEYKP
jgi:hypothetical protein